MKTISSLRRFPRWTCLLVLLALPVVGLDPLNLQAQALAPVITSVSLDPTNVIVEVRVPADVRRVTLECRERLGAGTWEPRAVARLNGAGGEITFRLPRASRVELMRVRADASEPLASPLYTGTNVFYNQPSSGSADWTRLDAPVTPNAGVPEQNGGGREVVESDIWKIRGQTLYFFNQNRGLQVIEIADPDNASVRGTIELPAVGEDLYLLGTNHVVLLARNGCSYNESEVILVDDGKADPSVVARLPVAGYITESRLVGTALYLASQTSRPVTASGGSTWEWGTLVSSFDLTDPNAPVARNSLWYPGYGNVVTATDRLLFVVTQDPTNWWRSVLRSIDITDPNGTMADYYSIAVAGRLDDKFKINWNSGVLTSISEDWRSQPGVRVTTMLETFRLPDPRSMGPLGVTKLGELELGRGEQLHATRFDGNRAYIVTFFQIDPLWVVDLSNPATPRIAGSVEVPGWSTFIQPLGDRLVSVGVETNRVAVSLFDVANPAAPALLSRVLLGQNYSWSEANGNEKAFSVLPDSGLILVPFSSHTTNGYASQVQLIDLKRDSIEARGVIEHPFQPRRATVYHDRILSLSGWELLSVDATDRDHPAVRGITQLAWPVDRVLLAGGFVLEVGSSGWSGSGTPTLRVASADEPNVVLSQINLAELPVIGAVTRGDRLYLAQGQQGWISTYPIVAEDGTTSEVPRSKFRLTVVGLNNLPAVQVLSETDADVGGLGFGNFEALWPRDNLLVWTGGGGGFNYWWWDFGQVSPLLARPGFWPPFGGGGGGQLLAFEVNDAGAAELVSEVNLATNSWWNFSKAFMAAGRVYLSHEVSTYSYWPWMAVPLSGTGADVDGSIDPTVTDPQPVSLAQWFLDVVDYADPKEPLVRRPVNIPGKLHGLGTGGEILFTVGTHFQTNAPYDWREFLDVSAYDGVAAHLIDSLPLPEAWPRPLLVAGTNIFLGRTTYTNSVPGGGPHALETWFLSADGRLTQSSSVTLTSPASSLADFDSLLAVQRTDNTVMLFDATHGAALRLAGEGGPTGCLWFNLDHADGALGRGLWIPLGAFGVGHVPALALP